MEQCNGIVKRRFAGLHYGLRVQPPRACATVVAAVVLHNIAATRRDELEEVGVEQNVDPNAVFEQRDGGRPIAEAVRRRIVENYFM